MTTKKGYKMKKKSKFKNKFPEWTEVRKELFTKEEILESDLRVALIGEVIKLRKKSGYTQRDLEKKSGIKQPVIARMENYSTNPDLRTLIRILSAFNKTLYIGDIKTK